KEPRGEKGFGFDPIFVPSEYGETRTFAEMEIEEKNRYSHRAKAVKSVLEQLLSDINSIS
ncbi:MAG: non-canonical purine NTP pyrophosphatase, partial [Desulfurococcaceae archaeon]